jgi:copper chaperone for superoxide dismutase
VRLHGAKRLVAIPGITKVEANLKDQLVFIEGTAPPSSIVTAIQNTGRDAILRGTGASNSTFHSALLAYARNVSVLGR